MRKLNHSKNVQNLCVFTMFQPIVFTELLLKQPLEMDLQIPVSNPHKPTGGSSLAGHFSPPYLPQHLGAVELECQVNWVKYLENSHFEPTKLEVWKMSFLLELGDFWGLFGTVDERNPANRPVEIR